MKKGFRKKANRRAVEQVGPLICKYLRFGKDVGRAEILIILVLYLHYSFKKSY